MTLDEVLREVDRLDKESKELKADIMKLCWYMRGGISLDEAFCLCYGDRQILADIVKDNLETTKKTGMPFF
jgi:hypothetical protein